MGLRHREHDVEGVQFHPESILSEHGHAMLGHFWHDAPDKNTDFIAWHCNKHLSGWWRGSPAAPCEAMTTVMTGEATSAQIGALLVALRMKGEAIDEITGAAEVMRELVTPVALSGDDFIDLVGTGGDGANLHC